MQRDIRDTERFRSIEQQHREWLRPGEQVIAELVDAVACPRGQAIAATGVMCDELSGTPQTRLVEIGMDDGRLSVLTRGPHSDKTPGWSPDGTTVAFLSNRDNPAVFKLYLLDRRSALERPAAGIDGYVEYHHWSADGQQLLVGVAGLGADLPGALGGFSLAAADSTRPDWTPELDTGVAAEGWRSVWLYDLATDTARQVSPVGVNIWESAWCGPDAFVAICSDAPEEDAWYTADVRHFTLASGDARTLYVPKDHLGWISAAPQGHYVAVVEAICSDRTIVAGDLCVIHTATGAVERPGTCNTDISSTLWRGDHHILLAGMRGPDSLILLFDLTLHTTRELWCDRETTPSGVRFPQVFPLGASAEDCLFIREGWFARPTLCALRNRQLREIVTFGTERLHARVERLGQARALMWQAADGLQIWGWLLTPPGPAPHPLVLHIHGGPVWYSRQRYLGRDHLHQGLLSAGYAVLDVNPRGSSGRGQDFARRVFGDMGGADSQDHLAGLDRLVADGVADPRRLGVTGGSYGGFMSAWLITQDPRFAAAVVLAPITNWVSEQLTAHIAKFCETALAGDIDAPSSQHFSRSPIHHAAKVRTPTLNVCGALDKTTPPGQALEFHRALLKHGIVSRLVTYPQEGHGIRKMPAVFDYLARLVDWFDQYMPAR